MRFFPQRSLKVISTTDRVVDSKHGIKRIIHTPLYLNSLYLIADTLVTSFFGFLFWVVAARFCSEADVGSATAIISSVNLLAIFSTVGINLSIIRFLPSSAKPRHLINSAITAISVIAFFAGCVFVAGLSIWSPALVYIQKDVFLLITFLFIVPFLTILNLIDSIFIAKRTANLVVFTSFIMSILRIGLLIAMAFIFKDSVIVFSWGLALIITLLISFIWLLPRTQVAYKPVPSMDIRQLKGLSQYSTGSYIATLLAQLPIMVMPLLVLNILGAQSNAYFYMAWTISGFLSAIPLATSRSLFAEGAHSLQNINKNVTKSLKFTFILSILAFIVIGSAAKWILLAFGSGYSANGIMLLWILSLANLIRGVFLIYTSLLRILDRLKELVMVHGIMSVAAIVFSYWAIKNFGLIGIGYAWLLTQIVIAVIAGVRLIFQLRHLQKNEVASVKVGKA